MAGLTTLDFVIIAVVGLGVWRGARTGAALQLVGAVGLLVAFLAAALLMRPVGDVVVASLGVAEQVGPVVGFVVTFAAVVAVAAVVGQLARKTLSLLRLGAVDRAAGGGLGGLRAALWLSVLMLIVRPVQLMGAAPPLLGTDLGERSVLYEPVRSIAPAAWHAVSVVVPTLRSQLRDVFGDDGDDAERTLSSAGD